MEGDFDGDPVVSGDAAGWQLDFIRSRPGTARSAEDHVIAHALDADIVTAMRRCQRLP